MLLRGDASQGSGGQSPPRRCSVEADDEKQLDSFLDFLKSHKTISRLEILGKKKNFAIMDELSTADSSGTYETLYRNKCYVMPGMCVYKGLEWWHILAKNPGQVTKLFEELKQIGDLYVEKIGKYEIEKKRFDLTEKQEKALSLAMKNEYYEWPRKVTLEELASMVNISRRALQDRLRRGESKIMHSVLAED